MAIYVVGVTAIEILVFQHYNSLLNRSNQTDITIPTTVTKSQSASALAELKKLQQKYPIVAVSDDGTMAAYADTTNTVHIVDLVHHKQLSSVAEQGSVQYLEWIRNDSVFVGVQLSPGTLQLSRVEYNTGVTQPINTFQGLDATASFRKIAFSTLTNDVYILIATQYSSVIYHYDTNGNINRVSLGGRYIKNIAVSQTGNILYFEDELDGTFNVLYLQQGVLHTVILKGALIEVVGNTLYYGSINSNGLVTEVYKYDDATEQGVLVAALTQPTLAEEITVNQNGKVYIHHSLPDNVLQNADTTNTTYSAG